MVKERVLVVVGSCILLLTVFLIVIGIDSDVMNDLSQEKFPDMTGVSKTTLHIDEPLEDIIGNQLDGFERMEFYGDLTIEFDDQQDEYSAVLNKRGATSFEFSKPQFSVSFVDENRNQIDKQILDMPKGEDWILHGPYIDRSMLRNYIAYKTSSDIMPYAPRAQYTELYVQVKDQAPTYIGLYLWIEKVRRDTDRVNINPSYENQEATSFIVQKNEYKDDDKIFSVYGKDLYMYSYVFSDVYPKRTLTEEQTNYIGDVLTTFERNLYHDKYDIPQKGYREFIEVSSFVDYYIINEFFMNTDAGHKSTYLYKDIRGPINIGPVWDFNNAMGNVNAVFKMQSYEGLFMHDRIWYDKLLKDPTFALQVVERYKILRQGPLSTDTLLEDIDEAYKILKPFVDKDHAKYTEEDVYAAKYIFLHREDTALAEHLEDQSQNVMDFEDEVNALKEFITNRGSWLDENINSILKWTE